jgi:hypothetical protein
MLSGCLHMTNLTLLEALDDHLVVLNLSGHLVLLLVQARHLEGVEVLAVDDVELVSTYGHHALLVGHTQTFHFMYIDSCRDILYYLHI